ncbi:MAG: 2-hydroxyacid dehydrogenase [Clostridiaceae bacterium]|nr:2-hydroxyacid dehydrogenase [Clostridiaceae bacterium]
MKLAFFDTKPYDRIWFDKLKEQYEAEIKYFEVKLNEDTAPLAAGCDCVCVFVNDTVDEKAIGILYDMGINLIALRCAGYNNVDFKAAYGKIHIVRVPAYSPYAVAEHAIGMLLSVNRKLHRAFNRTRDFNFNINGFVGFDLHGKTVGVLGTGRIGRCFIDICRGFGLQVLAYDPYPAEDAGIEYVSVEELCKKSDIISLHCPLTPDTHHIINEKTISQMKDGVLIINTSRGALIDSEALLEGLKSKKIGGAGLDVYEEEADLFFEDFSNQIIQDDILARLLSLPNVLITSHQAFLTQEALKSIAETTFENIVAFFNGDFLKNEICYQCDQNGTCKKDHAARCF